LLSWLRPGAVLCDKNDIPDGLRGVTPEGRAAKNWARMLDKMPS
jgi:hypothetical protein